MNLKGKIIALLLVIVIGTILLSVVEEKLNPTVNELTVDRKQQHIQAMESGANPSIGTTTIAEDGTVGKNFVSHLPLVVIDIGNQKIPVTKRFALNEYGDEIIEHTGADPYVEGHIHLIDNPDYINSLTDTATMTSNMKIKYRGNTSLTLEKKQYGIKLYNEDGTNRRESVLGMTANNDWVLNGSMIDSTLIRNYMSYNLGSVFFPYTTEVRYCEVILKRGDIYKYQGVYLMMEKVEEGNERVDLKDYQKGDDFVSYLLCRDRQDSTELQLSTYGSKNRLSYGALSVLYPTTDILDSYALDYITKDIDNIEKILYSDDVQIFSTWTEYLDTQSFVDYFVFNEMMGNFDAGENSTYMYRNQSGKLCMGPVWDYDGAMDNYSAMLYNPQQIVFDEQPWFDRLCLSEVYVNGLIKRYGELRGSILSAEYLNAYVDEVSRFLGNAALREWSRWEHVYGVNGSFDSEYDQDGYPVDRTREHYNEDVQRLKDYFSMKEIFMEEGLEKLQDDAKKTSNFYGQYLVIILILVLVCSAVLISRRKYFK